MENKLPSIEQLASPWLIKAVKKELGYEEPLIIGKIIHYDQDKKFGFIEVDGHDRTIFFHNLRQKSYYCGIDNAIHIDGPPCCEPTINDAVIIYDVELVDKGPRATWWAFYATYEEARDVQKLMPLYRLIRRQGREKISHLDPTPKITVLCESKNLLELKNVLGFHRVEHDEFDYWYFEVENESGFWDRCVNPLIGV